MLYLSQGSRAHTLATNPWLLITAQFAHLHKPQKYLGALHVRLCQLCLSGCSWHLQMTHHPMSWLYFEIRDYHKMIQNRMCISRPHLPSQNEQLKSSWSCSLSDKAKVALCLVAALFTFPGGQKHTQCAPFLNCFTTLPTHCLFIYLFLAPKNTMFPALLTFTLEEQKHVVGQRWLLINSG